MPNPQPDRKEGAIRKALQNLGLGPPDRNVRALSLDGGGFHVMFTLQLLRQMERAANHDIEPEDHVVCAELFDLIGGTSAGAITAAIMMRGYPSWGDCAVDGAIRFWRENLDLFPVRNPIAAAAFEAAKFLGSDQLHSVARNLFLTFDPPLYDKARLRYVLKDLFGDTTLGELAKFHGHDVMLLCKNVSTGRMVPLSAFLSEDKQTTLGPYSNVLVRAAVEAAASPPMGMQPFGHYIDAGFGVYNNPESIVFSRIAGGFVGIDPHVSNKYLAWLQDPDVNSDDYRLSLLSFGTGYFPEWLLSQEAAQRPTWPGGAFWLGWFMYAVGNDASLASSDLFSRLSTGALQGVLDYRRFQMSFNASIARKLPNIPLPPIPGIRARATHELTPRDMYYCDWGLDPNYIPLYEALGSAFYLYMVDRQNGNFKEGMGNELIDMPASDAVIREMSDPVWVDAQPTGPVSFLPNFKVNHPG